MFGRHILRDDQVGPLADAVLGILEDVGLLCQNDDIARALEAAGARVDYATERVKLPRKIVADFVDALREENAGHDDWGDDLVTPGLGSVDALISQFYFDDEAWVKRSANKADFVTVTRFADALHGDQEVGHSLALTDVPPMLEPLEAGLLLAEHAHHPQAPFAWNVRQCDYLAEMGAILGIDRWFSYGAICFAHPLRFDRDCADRFVRRARDGVNTGLTAMPVGGATTPVTLEGFIAVASAEHVATWFAARALNPKVPLGGSMWAGSVDMKSGHVSYSAFDAMMYGFAAVEFLRRWCGMLVPIGSGEYCEARVPGLYTALEKAYKSVLASAFTGQPLASGVGHVDNGSAFSPAQLLLDREYATAMQQYGRAVDVTPDNLAMPTIREVGLGLDTNYLEAEHTLHNFRACLWLPQLIDRTGWNGCEGEKAAMDRAVARTKDLLASYRKPEGRDDQLAAMREVVARARRDLLG
jgi:trimethylamine--corrinoid protein Co-methyltransferase